MVLNCNAFLAQRHFISFPKTDKLAYVNNKGLETLENFLNEAKKNITDSGDNF